MSEYLTEKEMLLISVAISKQKGQNYPCSNQIVTCGIFSSEEYWDEFCLKNEYKMKRRTKYWIEFEYGERWTYFNPDIYPFRGFRFHKIKVTRNINRRLFLECVYPCCALYCKEIEWC